MAETMADVLREGVEARTGFKIETCPRCGFVVTPHETETECIRVLKLKVHLLEDQIISLKADLDRFKNGR